MAKRAKAGAKRPGRVRIAVERVVLGALMSAVVYFAERRPRKVFEGTKPEAEGDLFDKSVEIG